MDKRKTFLATHNSGDSKLMQVHLSGRVKLNHSLFLGFDIFAKIDLSEASLCNFLLNFEFSKEDYDFIWFIHLDLLLICRYLLFSLLRSWSHGYFLFFDKIVTFLNILYPLSSHYIALTLLRLLLLLPLLVHF